VKVVTHWVVFAIVVIAALAFDLLVLNLKDETPSTRKAITQTLFWVSIGMVFAIGLALFGFGTQAVWQYLGGYVMEWSLSVDNVFVWGIILRFFKVSKDNQHIVLVVGIVSAIALRFVFIILGVTAISHFAWMTVGLGLFLVWTAFGLARNGDEPKDIRKMNSYRLLSRIVPIAEGQHGAKFFVRENGKRMATGLLLCAIFVGVADIIFAFDSVPAIFGITHDVFIVFSSNAMALMGLRSLFVLFDSVKSKFSRLNEGLAAILAGIGVKMVISSKTSIFGLFHLPGIEFATWMSLAFIAVALSGSVVASKIWPKKK
jgi:tellurite resistance protein TerC